MKKGIFSLVCTTALLSAGSLAFAGAYGEQPQPEEMPAPAPAPAPAPIMEPEPEGPIMRKFEGFVTDAETTRGFWGEISSVYYDEGSADAISTLARVAFGSEMFEVGAQLPYEWFDAGPVDDSGLADLQAWGKLMPVRTDVVDFGFGLVLTAPTGDDPTFSPDEWGFEPFATAGVAVSSSTSLRGSIGYQVFTDFDLLDGVPYNVAALIAVADNVVLRGELDGTHYTERNFDENELRFVPGVDVSVPLGGVDLVLRPTASIGINDAEDWGLGLGLALTTNAG